MGYVVTSLRDSQQYKISLLPILHASALPNA